MPALLNTDTAMNQPCHSDSPNPCPSARNRGTRTTASPTVIERLATMTALMSEPTSPSRVTLVSAAVSSLEVSPTRRETASPRIEASVMTPSPPTIIPIMMTT
ncbi:hypothetical protein GCM10027212_12290 [Actinotalea caeni]